MKDIIVQPYLNEYAKTFNDTHFHNIKFHKSGISIDTDTGEVTIPEGMELSEASREIWLGIKQFLIPTL